MKKIIFALIATSFSVAAAAADTPYYVGASVGRAEQKLNIDGASLSDNAVGFGINGGYRFPPNFSAEVGYATFGKATASGGGASLSTEPKAAYVAGVGSWSVSPEIAVFGKV